MQKLILFIFLTSNYQHGGHIGGIRIKESHYLSLKLAPTWLLLYCLKFSRDWLQGKMRISFALEKLVGF